ncbi:MAG: carbohydrate porin [Akkermansia sp.]|nr:carbohydrate porin [Akkermansia sp.]
MKTNIPATLVLAAAGLTAAAQDSLSDYLDTAFGRAPYKMETRHVGSLQASMRPDEQHPARHAGIATAAEILERSLALDLKEELSGWILFPSSPQKFAPYLDSLFVPGNTCIQPSDIISHDALSAAAQNIKSRLSRYGIQYSLTLTGNYTGIAPRSRGGRNDFASTNNSFAGTWYLLKKADNSQGLFLSIEADWGHGFNFNENRSSAQNTIGSLSNPQGSLRGGNGVFIPHLALGYSAFNGKWVSMVGTIDTSSYLDQNIYAGSWNGNLTNSAFGSNPCLPLEWANWGYLTAWQPCDSFYAMYATTGCNGKINHNPFRSISRNAWVHLTEFGYIADDFLGLGKGTYRLQYTITRHKGETGFGVACNIQQQLGHGSPLGFFTRCGFMDSDAASVSGVRTAATAGLVLQAPFSGSGWGSKANNDQLALGFLWERAADSPHVHKDEYGLELSAVVQVTPTFFIQPDVQWIFNPAHQTDRSSEFIFQVQTVFRF